MTYSELRASDAERERVVAFLREHALLGRLSDDELEERIGLAYAAVTVGDLERLIRDLPRKNRHPSQRSAHETARRHPPKGALIAAGLGACLLTGVPFVVLGLVMAIGVAILATVFALSMVFGPVLLVIVLVMALRRRRPRRPPMRWGPQY